MLVTESNEAAPISERLGNGVVWNEEALERCCGDRTSTIHGDCDCVEGRGRTFEVVVNCDGEAGLGGCESEGRG